MIVFSFAACVDLFNTKVGRRCNGRIKLIKPIINNFKLFLPDIGKEGAKIIHYE